MQFLISTVSSDVLVGDLGLLLVHPIIDRDLSLEFTPEEIAESAELTSSIVAGTLTLRLETNEYGIYSVSGINYEPYSLFQQNLDTGLVESVITEGELSSGFATTQIRAGAFPVSITSITAITDTIIVNTAKFQDWRLSPGDNIFIFGNGSNDGYKIVSSIISQTTFTTIEALVTTGGVGSLIALNPPGASRIGIDDTGFVNIVGDTAQELFSDIDTKISASGISSEVHKTLRQLIHLADNGGPFEGFTSGAFKETLPSNSMFPTSITWWESSAKLKRIVDKTISYSLGKVKPTPIVYRVYNTDGITVMATATDDITYSGVVELNRVRSIV